jgi:hypothetical protein
VPGDSGAWVLAQPLMPPAESATSNLGVRNTPVLGSVLHGFVSAEGVDLIMFQPWEYIAHAFHSITGERCAPLRPLSNELAELRFRNRFSPGCGVCLNADPNHFIENCPERFTPEHQRSKGTSIRLDRIEIFRKPGPVPFPPAPMELL